MILVIKNMPTGKLAKKKKIKNGNQYLTKTTGSWVKNLNASEATYKPKQHSYITTKLFFVGIFHRSIDVTRDYPDVAFVTL